MTTAIKNNYLGTAIAIAANVHKTLTRKPLALANGKGN